MKINNKGMSAVSGLLVVVLVILAVVGLGSLAARFIFKPDTSPSSQGTGTTFKVDKAQMIADLERQVRKIPADQVAANVRGYENLLALDPKNENYRQKLAYYRERLKAEGAEAKPAKSYVKVAFPAPQVLERPDTGEMIGRAAPGEMVAVLETAVVRKGSTYINWYRIPHKNGSGWISQMGVFGDVITKTETADDVAAQEEKWRVARQGLMEAYRGKVTAVETISPETCHVQVSADLSFEEARQVSERVGYYLRNSTGESPVVTVYVDEMQIAVAQMLANKYIGKLDVRKR